MTVTQRCVFETQRALCGPSENAQPLATPNVSRIDAERLGNLSSILPLIRVKTGVVIA